MNRKNRAKKRILLLVLMLFATTGLLTASTFAWFTANKTVTISPIQVNVEAQGGIQISADGTTWKSVVSVTAPAIAHAFDTYGLTVNTTDAVPYSGIKAPFASALDLKVGQATAALYPTYFDAMNPTYQTIEGFSDNLQVFSLPAGISKVRIYMWMEGQDVDCENAASGGQAIFNVQLTTETP